MENLKIKIIITDNEKELKLTSINVNDYLNTKELHGVSIVDETILNILGLIIRDNNEIDEITELLYEQLFGKFSVLNVTDLDKKAVIRTALSSVKK